MHFELPPAYKMEHMKTKLTWMHTSSPILAVGSCTICHFAKYATWKRFSIRDVFLIHPVRFRNCEQSLQLYSVLHNH